ncbi:MAG TPA: DUF2231 domain-containing protein [Candidatus Dormibacteraeota bacterium]|jgi:uncharacterized membrane protein
MSIEPSVTNWIDRWETIRQKLPAINPVLKGHPLHAIMTDMPAALIPMGFTFSLLGRMTKGRELEAAGYLNSVAGVALAVPTALFGIADYLQMDARDPAQPTGVVHGLLNTVALGLGIASLMGRSVKRPGSPRGLWLGGLSTIVLFASAYLGGDLVFHRGWRVKPMEREEFEHHRVPETVHADDFILRGSARVPVTSQRS